ncbi:HAMP domain-containing histidine kinase [Flavobacterium jejuense]|uniref:histidine kinase n=1 Tax=Flavobacterium jejuense TaxID=1544455 RepID=A0ABX0IR31_9FLAO|nr:ATP-binding protein [Flavobacterium jejuense]NHN26294.1 HAMP domain-containing histidine kinase [Flavobacterium jejuense]
MNRFYFIFFLFQFGYSQQNFYEKWYSADTEHLPQNSVKSISPDKYGFIWMTTENGLVRFDGEKFKVYNSSNTNTVSNRFLYLSGNIQQDSLSSFTEDYSDNIFITNRKATKLKQKISKELTSEYDNKRFYLNHNNKNRLNFDLLYSKIHDTKGNYYLIEKNKISFFDKKGNTKSEVKHKYSSTNDYFLIKNELICMDPKGNYSLYKDKFLNLDKINIPTNSKIIYNYLSQQYFVCTNKKILLVKKTTNKLYLKTLHEQSNIRNYIPRCAYYDIKNNKLFIGTDNKGLTIITLNKFKVLTNKKNINNNYYSTIPISKNEFITAKGEIYNKDELVIDLKLNTLGNQYGITLDLQKNIWIQNDNKLIRFNKATNYKSHTIINFNLEVATIFCDSKNKIWIGFKNDSNKLAVVATINAYNKKPIPIFLKHIVEPVNFFAETEDHSILMAGKKTIITYNETNNKIKRIPTGKNDVRSIFICKDKNIWICTYSNGFSLLKNDIFYKLPYDTNLFLNSAHCINEDKDGHFWISTNKGLIEVDKKSLLKHLKDNSPIYYHHYDAKNGFLTNEFNGGCQPCNSTLENGYYIYPSLNGLVVFHPEKVNKILPSGDFYINEVETENKTIHFNDTLFTDRVNNRIEVKIDFPYYGNENNIHFEAKLQLGDNDKWTNLFNEKSISYTNLPPGNHTLFIRKLGDFSSKYQVKKITICVPFLYYETLWFKVFIFLLIAGLFIYTVRLRYNYIEKKNQELEQIIDERTNTLIKTVNTLKITKNNLTQEIIQQKKLIGTISHDIKSPLKFLTITAKHLNEKSLFLVDNSIKEETKVMHESANQLYRFVENLIDYSKIFIGHKDMNQQEKKNITWIINEKIKLFKSIAEANAVIITYKDFTTSQVIVNKKILNIIIHNLLDNATKNTVNGTITIEANTTKNKIYISIEDTGTGMPDEIRNYYINLHKNFETDKLAIQNYGFGLHMVLELLRLLKGDLKIYSKENIGTKVVIILDY